ncbi:DMT family transporter [Pseudalkalibacillus hwajinpoensis]|uniref:EamA family transporter n=1 Tax=Guptibacillus hwajinpoensis TaxID=208199 RepID=UPI00325A7D43
MKWKYMILVLLAGCCVGSLSTITKIGIANGYTVGELLAGQFIIGWILLIVLGLCSKNKTAFKELTLLVVGGIAIGCVSIFYTLSVSMLPASIAVLLLFQFTWIGIVIDSVAMKKWPEKRTVFSVVVILGGTFLASGMMESRVLQYDPLGVLLGLLAAVSFAVYIFVMGRTSAEVPAIQKSLFMMTTAGILVLTVFSPFSLVQDGVSEEWLLYSLFLALLGNIFPVLFMSIGVPKIGSSMGTILSSSELPAAVLLSAVVLNETIGRLQWIGVLMIFAAIVVSQWSPVRKKKIKKAA